MRLKIILPLLIIAFSFFVTNKASADYVVGTQTQTHDTAEDGITDYYQVIQVPIGFTPQGVSLYFGTVDEEQFRVAVLQHCASDGTGCTLNVTSSTHNDVEGTNINQVFDLLDNVTSDPEANTTQYIKLVVQRVGGSTDDWSVWGSVADEYDFSNCRTASETDCTNIDDIFFRILGQLGDNITNIYLNDPPFEPYMSTKDFTNWFVCTNILPDLALTDFYVKVHYGTAIGDFEDQSSTRSTIDGEYNECFRFTKTEDLTPGGYVASPRLYDATDDSLVDLGALYDEYFWFTILSGSQLELPVNENVSIGDPVLQCTDSNFVFDGVCKAALFLFIPDETFTERIDETKDLVFDQAPFAYFEPLRSEFETLEGSPGFDPISITLAAPFGEEYDDLELEVLTDDNPYLAVADDVFPWIIVGLWLSFAYYLAFRIFHIFRPA